MQFVILTKNEEGPHVEFVILTKEGSPMQFVILTKNEEGPQTQFVILTKHEEGSLSRPKKG
jgi:hypothetical protein